MGTLIRQGKVPISYKEIGPDFLKKSGFRTTPASRQKLQEV